MSTIEFRLEQRQRLYYRKYLYAIDLEYQGFKYLDRNDISSLAPYAYATRQSYRTFGNNSTTMERMMQTATALKDFELASSDFKTFSTYNHRFYYVNDDRAIDKLLKIPNINLWDYRKADVCLPDDVIIRKNNPYQYRTYFRERKITPTRALEFLNKIIPYGDYFSMSEATRSRIARCKYSYPFARHSYIDHHDKNDRLMLEMLLPGYFSTTLPIQTK